MEMVSVVLRQIVIMYLMMGLGTLLALFGFLDEDFRLTLSKLLLNVVVPCLLISSFQMEYSPSVGRKLLLALALSVLIQVLCIAVGRVLFRNRKDAASVCAKMCVDYSNCGFMGLPLLHATLGADGVFFASVFIIVFNLAFWTHGCAVFGCGASRGGGHPWYQILLIPSVSSALLGVALYFLPARLPGVVNTALCYVADTNTPLAMLVLGGFLVHIDWRSILTDGKSLLAYLGRLILAPLVCLAVLIFIPLDPTVRTAMLIISAMPASTSLGLQAAVCGADGPYATQLVAVSTLLSAVTVPAITLLGGMFIH